MKAVSAWNMPPDRLRFHARLKRAAFTSQIRPMIIVGLRSSGSKATFYGGGNPKTVEGLWRWFYLNLPPDERTLAASMNGSVMTVKRSDIAWMAIRRGKSKHTAEHAFAMAQAMDAAGDDEE